MRERHIKGGTIQVDHQDGLVRARGVRYGTARRFAVAEPPPAWSGVRDATQPGPACPQRPSRLDWVTGDALKGLTTDENCLVLSVTAPANAQRLPVMVWFHGGAYVAGSGESAKYDPAALARAGNVVVVNVSYRLGIFGYLAPPGVGADNLGLRDQILALRWVQDNIAAFGGDAANVTAFGQSAGAHSVWSLMLSEGAAGLFHRAILQSAPLELDDGRDDMAVAMRSAMAIALAAPTRRRRASSDCWPPKAPLSLPRKISACWVVWRSRRGWAGDRCRPPRTFPRPSPPRRPASSCSSVTPRTTPLRSWRWTLGWPDSTGCRSWGAWRCGPVRRPSPNRRSRDLPSGWRRRGGTTVAGWAPTVSTGHRRAPRWAPATASNCLFSSAHRRPGRTHRCSVRSA
ncbi:carboxylesterase family protein [Mycolicibacterium fortuitum]